MEKITHKYSPSHVLNFNFIYNSILKIPRLMYSMIERFNNLGLNKIFQALPFIYSVLAFLCIIFGVILVILYVFSFKNIITKDVAQQIHSSLYLMLSFFMICSIIYITFYKDINISVDQPINILANTINSNTAGIVIIHLLLVSITVIIIFLMSVVSSGLTKAYYSFKSIETNETPKVLWWGESIDKVMHFSFVISVILLLCFFVAKLIISDINVYIKSSVQTFFVVSGGYYLSKLFLNMLSDLISNNLLILFTQDMHKNSTLFVFNIMLAIIIYLCVFTLIIFNFYALAGVLTTTNKVLDVANKVRPIFYGIIPQSLIDNIKPYLKNLNINSNKQPLLEEAKIKDLAPNALALAQNAQALATSTQAKGEELARSAQQAQTQAQAKVKTITKRR